jgi:hypothetical protein
LVPFELFRLRIRLSGASFAGVVIYLGILIFAAAESSFFATAEPTNIFSVSWLFHYLPLFRGPTPALLNSASQPHNAKVSAPAQGSHVMTVHQYVLRGL